jgi:hypothetical protein
MNFRFSTNSAYCARVSSAELSRYRPALLASGGDDFGLQPLELLLGTRPERHKSNPYVLRRRKASAISVMPRNSAAKPTQRIKSSARAG